MPEEKTPESGAPLRAAALFGLDMSWQLLCYHLDDLADEECLWRSRAAGPHVRLENGVWRADWPDTEAYEAGPPNIAWVTWHIMYWWTMALDHTFGAGTCTRESVAWPGGAEQARDEINRLHDEWAARLQVLPEEEFLSCACVRWPFEGRPLHELAAWLNLELMKNAAEIGYTRFLYATRENP